MVGRIIHSDACLSEGAAWLGARDAGMARAIACSQPLPLRRQPDGFAALLEAIVGQQVSVASAAAVMRRLTAAGLTDPQALCAASPDDLRTCGLSRQKARYARALAEAGIDFDALRDLPDAVVIDRLIVVPGIGRWTAEIYAMMALGRADVFAAGDLALQEGARMLYGLASRPSEKALRTMAESWQPWRSVAANVLWSYYQWGHRTQETAP
jgi:DNA-3-methyladenine glycosylase II